jgi:dual-specificity kinase
MSTPTTATATLPPYGHIHQNPYSFSHSSYPSASSYRTAASGLIPATSRLGPSAYSTPTSNTTYTGANTTSRTNGLNNGQTNTTTARRARESTDYEGREDGHYSTMPTGSSGRSGDGSQPARKRRRSQEPDWNTFYKNGLPREIIVIDDTPEPDAATTTASQRLVNGVNGTNGLTDGVNGDSTGRHLAKKRRRDEVGHYDPVRNNISHNGTTPQQYATPSGSTISSDRTNSAHQTTAATSLGSSSSNGHYENESQVGAKRKRTRQQIANEAKRRELGAHSSSYHSYRPPPHPPKKAADVHVKVITDVS